MKYNTIIFVPHAKAKFRKVTVSTRFLSVIAGSAALVLLAAVTFGWAFLSSTRRDRQYLQVLADNARLKSASAALRGRLQGLSRQLSDIESRTRWVEYSRAKDENFRYTDTKQSPWFVVNSDDKKRARLNVISHLLMQIAYQDVAPEMIELPPRQPDDGYIRPPMNEQTFVPEVY